MRILLHVELLHLLGIGLPQGRHLVGDVGLENSILLSDELAVAQEQHAHAHALHTSARVAELQSVGTFEGGIDVADVVFAFVVNVPSEAGVRIIPALHGEGVYLVAVGHHLHGPHALVLGLELHDAIGVSVGEVNVHQRAARLHVVLLLELLHHRCRERLRLIVVFAFQLFAALQIALGYQQIEASVLALHLVLRIGEGVSCTLGGNACTAMDDTEAGITAVGILQQVVHIFHIHHRLRAHKQFSVERGTAAEVVLQLPRLMVSFERFVVVATFLRLFKLTPEGHLHVLFVKIAQEHGQGSGVVHGCLGAVACRYRVSTLRARGIPRP